MKTVGKRIAQPLDFVLDVQPQKNKNSCTLKKIIPEHKIHHWKVSTDWSSFTDKEQLLQQLRPIKAHRVGCYPKEFWSDKNASPLFKMEHLAYTSERAGILHACTQVTTEHTSTSGLINTRYIDTACNKLTGKPNHNVQPFKLSRNKNPSKKKKKMKEI